MVFATCQIYVKNANVDDFVAFDTGYQNYSDENYNLYCEAVKEELDSNPNSKDYTCKIVIEQDNGQVDFDSGFLTYSKEEYNELQNTINTKSWELRDIVTI